MSTGPDPWVDDADLISVLTRGELEVVGRIVDASNATLYSVAELDGVTLACVYKPVEGERPLWDFPRGTLAMREVATYLVCVAAGWQVVPPTVLRQGPFGLGSVQVWVGPQVGPDGAIAADPSGAGTPGADLIEVVPRGQVPPGWLRVVDADSYDGAQVSLVHADDADLRRMTLLDVVTNNADRKGGHVLRDPQGRVFGVDHGLTFHTEDKLRTVLWGWAGQRLDDEGRACLEHLAAQLDDDDTVLHQQLCELLSEPETRRTAARARTLLERDRFPRPRGGRPHIPWPAF